MDAARIGIIGDYDPEKVSHPETAEAIRHAADRFSIDATIDWIASPELSEVDPTDRLARYDGLFASPGFCKNLDGALRGIQYARESGKPFVAT